MRLYVWMRRVWSICVSAHVRMHTFASLSYASLCRNVHLWPCLWVCVLFSLCMFHTQHCLLETLSKSPQCDNWLPGVSVSLLLIIVIPCRKKNQCDRQSSLVCRVNWSQVCLNSFCEMKLWGYVTAGAILAQPGCRLLSAACNISELYTMPRRK